MASKHGLFREILRAKTVGIYIGQYKYTYSCRDLNISDNGPLDIFDDDQFHSTFKPFCSMLKIISSTVY